jgi:hypothetical protein
MSALVAPPCGLVGLVAALAPYWGGEAEVVDAYFASADRSPESDRRWLARQCHKELVDGVDGRLAQLAAGLAGTGAGEGDRSSLRRWAHEAAEELDHYCLFADAHDALAPDRPPLTPEEARTAWTWAANDVLRALRVRHRAEHGRIGWRALIVTEGGYGVLYAAGAALAGRGGTDELIARACQRVLDDEVDHVLQGLAGGDAVDGEDWALLSELCVAQSAARIRMRDEQFGHPVDGARCDVLVAGGGPAAAFDWERCGFTPPHQPSASAARNSAVASR